MSRANSCCADGVALDVRCPAAMEQLAVLGRSGGGRHAADRRGPGTDADRATRPAGGRLLGSYDVVLLLDTAGRTTLDDADDGGGGRRSSGPPSPHEVLLVADSLHRPGCGQPGACVFNDAGRPHRHRPDLHRRRWPCGGAALSMRAVTGKLIKLCGHGREARCAGDFHPGPHLPDRILGMGDIVARPSSAAATIDAEKAARVAERHGARAPLRSHRPAARSACCRCSRWAA